MLVTGNSGSTNCSKESHGPNQQYRLIRIQQAIDIDTTCSQLIRDLFGRHSLGSFHALSAWCTQCCGLSGRDRSDPYIPINECYPGPMSFGSRTFTL
eukprot:m.197364 g.197364  ORF g.197364 m.197364 type:complete len:97 (+) comp15276_c0_seq4:3426-3716(+)